MLLLPFLAILLVATVGHVSSEETLSIPMLADFGTKILGGVITYCLKLDGEERKSQVISILCGSATELDEKFFDFGKIIMEQMNMGKIGTYEQGNSIFDTIKTHIENGMRLKKQKVKPPILDHYREFVTEIGKQIVGTMTGRLHLHIAKRWSNAEENENEKLNSLKNLFLTKVNTLKTGRYMLDIHEYMYGIQHVTTEIYQICKDVAAEKQLIFFLDFFVANLIYIEEIRHDMHITHNWQMRKMIEP